MKRILGLDLGTKRIGVAVSDPLRITAQPVTTLIVTTPAAIPEAISAIHSQYDAESIVIGLPLHMNGTEGEAARSVRDIAERLEVDHGIAVIFWDERLSSLTVEKAMLEDNMRRRKRRSRKDIMAAVVILQGYLDYLSR